MLKFFYRLKRRGGVVLFAVVAIMTLLITMASVAYFTARSSYKTVVSNYDFSQTYLSATSIADMVVSSVAYQSSRDTVNKFGDLKSLIKSIENDYVQDDLKNNADESKGRIASIVYKTATGEPSHTVYYLTDDDDPIYGGKKLASKTISDVDTVKKNVRITGTTANIKGKTGDDLLAAAGEDPVKSGIFDAVSIEISLDKVVPKDSSYERNSYYYTFTTNAYYKNNTISVQDTVYHESEPGGGTEPPNFDTFFTATGQILNGSGDIDYGTRAVIINTDHISDNAYFQNKDTVITRFGGGARTVHVDGGIQSTGNVWIDADFNNGKLPAPSDNRRHDWIIGGDLGLFGSNAYLNFNGNNLYVKGDLYICNQNAWTNIGTVVVEGNIYILDNRNAVLDIGYGEAADSDGAKHKSQIKNPGVYVKGENHQKETGVVGGIYSADNYSGILVYDYITVETKDENGDPVEPPAKYKNYPSARPSKYSTYFTSYALKDSDENSTETETIDGVTIRHHKLYFDKYFKGINDMCKRSTDMAGGSTWSLPDSPSSGGKALTTGNLYMAKKDNGVNLVNQSAKTPSSIDYKDLDVLYSSLNLKEDDEGNKVYDYEIEEKNIHDILSPESGMKKKDFAVYSAKEDTLKNVLELNFNQDFAQKLADGQREFSLGEVDGKEAKLIFTTGQIDSSDVTLVLPYVKDGYVLKYDLTSTTKTETKTDWWHQYPDGHWGRYDYEATVTENNFPVNANRTFDVQIKTGNSYIEGGEKKYTTMPIVLAANFFDGEDAYDPDNGKFGSAKDSEYYNAFSWRAGNFPNAGQTLVELVNESGSGSAEGFVVFEMGNIDVSDPDTTKHKYVTYSKENVTSTDSVVYYASHKEIIGTKNQVQMLKGKTLSNDSAFDDFYENTLTKQLKDLYQSKVLLVSNKNNSRKAIDMGNRDSTTLCGYIYAPNGSYACHNGNNSHPIFGGMIVSDYYIYESSYLYAQPDPNLIEGLTSSFDELTKKGGGGTDIWYTDGVGIGRNYLG